MLIFRSTNPIYILSKVSFEIQTNTFALHLILASVVADINFSLTKNPIIPKNKKFLNQ